AVRQLCIHGGPNGSEGESLGTVPRTPPGNEPGLVARCSHYLETRASRLASLLPGALPVALWRSAGVAGNASLLAAAGSAGSIALRPRSNSLQADRSPAGRRSCADGPLRARS